MCADAKLQGSFSNGSGEAVLCMLTVLLHSQALKALLAHFEVDFVSLSFVREGEDVHQAREFLDSLGHTTTKVQRLSPAGRAFKSWPPGACMLHAGCPAGSMPVLLDVTLLGHRMLMFYMLPLLKQAWFFGTLFPPRCNLWQCSNPP